ncbi:hypothetical protein KIN20_014072 [Parelaphostrongylus tenuis]|uniref:Uncharacterized protein n=1 Tax=Parelaphostrongylus tenuis TaxID=148309 RepID=A0AAD5N2S9_PARTN|nr:hypothetical protein KIN20_014072 [Parelaphostrongylus tenuis]
MEELTELWNDMILHEKPSMNDSDARKALRKQRIMRSPLLQRTKQPAQMTTIRFKTDVLKKGVVTTQETIEKA